MGRAIQKYSTLLVIYSFQLLLCQFSLFTLFLSPLTFTVTFLASHFIITSEVEVELSRLLFILGFNDGQ